MIADLKPYPAYKDSGVEWLGDVPKRWDTRPLKHWVTINAEVLPETTDPDRVFRYVDIGSVGTGSLTQKPQRLLFARAPSRARRIAHNGDTLVSTVRTYLKAIYFVQGEADEIVCSTGFAVLTPRVGTVPQFVSYLVRSNAFTDRVTADSVGTAYPAIAESRLGSFHVPSPPLPEQAAIVRFLDHADRRIRRYIRTKQKLIALLEEQKQAIIHQAVTGQIDVRTGQTYPAYKTSGVEWLGDVPENWEKRRLKSISRIRYGLGQPPRELSDGLPLIRATNVDHGRIVEKDLVYVDALDVPKSRDAFLSKKEIIVVRSGAYTADSAIIPEAYEGAVAGYDMIVTVSGAQPEFIAIALLSNYVRDDQLIISSTRSAQPHINAEELGTAVLLLPPLDEQAAIVRYLDRATADIDIATDRARRQIDLLKEYRTRLIADVVTGKLDVREAATGLPEVDLLADEFDVLTEAPETGMMELEDANETPEELAMENEATV